MLGHCFRQDVLDCPRCHARLEPIAVLRRHDVIERILRHLALPLGPTALGHPDTIAFDVIGEPMPGEDDAGVMGQRRARDGAWRGVDVCARIGAAPRKCLACGSEGTGPAPWRFVTRRLVGHIAMRCLRANARRTMRTQTGNDRHSKVLRMQLFPL